MADDLRTKLRGEARSPDEIRDAVYLFTGDVGAKQSRFWLLLVLSTAVATAGIVSDSTATVIGAMIIAPLATPIQGVAVGVAYGELPPLLRSAAVVLGAMAVVVGFAGLLSVILPELQPLNQNGQITSRTSPTIVDLAAATATGLAGAFAVARRDIGDILPGVAIAISLVPPLAVVGITVVAGDWSGAIGALVLFLTNALAMIVVGAALFWGIGLARGREMHASRQLRPVYTVLAVSSLVVVLLLAAATYRTVQVENWRAAATSVGEAWARDNDARLIQVRLDGSEVVVEVEGELDEAADQQLPGLLAGQLPEGTPVSVNRLPGRLEHVGDVPAA